MAPPGYNDPFFNPPGGGIPPYLGFPTPLPLPGDPIAVPIKKPMPVPPKPPEINLNVDIDALRKPPKIYQIPTLIQGPGNIPGDPLFTPYLDTPSLLPPPLSLPIPEFKPITRPPDQSVDQDTVGLDVLGHYQKFLSTYPEAEAIAKAIQPGDLLFLEGHNILGDLTQSKWVHVAMCIDAGNPLATPPIPARFIEAVNAPTRFLAAENSPGVMSRDQYAKQVGGPDDGKALLRTGVVVTPMTDVFKRYVGDGGLTVKNAARLVRPGAPPEKVRKAIEIAMSRLGRPYDYAFGQIEPNPEREYCSGLVYKAYELADFPLNKSQTAEHNRLPGAIALAIRELVSVDGRIPPAADGFIALKIGDYTNWYYQAKTDEEKEDFAVRVAHDLVQDVLPRFAKARIFLDGDAKAPAALKDVLVYLLLGGLKLSAALSRRFGATPDATGNKLRDDMQHIMLSALSTQGPGTWWMLLAVAALPFGFGAAAALLVNRVGGLVDSFLKVKAFFDKPPEELPSLVSPGDIIAAYSPLVPEVSVPWRKITSLPISPPGTSPGGIVFPPLNVPPPGGIAFPPLNIPPPAAPTSGAVKPVSAGGGTPTRRPTAGATRLFAVGQVYG